jgi:nucleoside-diphosphate-sugar epimerase
MVGRSNLLAENKHESARMRLFVFGLGYTALRLATRLQHEGGEEGWEIAGTSRTAQGVEALQNGNINATLFDGQQPMQDVSALKAATHVLVSTPPDSEGDPALRHHGEDVAAVNDLKWLGYLSTTGVYGDQQGAWVDERTRCTPTSDRGYRRLAAEQGWMQHHKDSAVPVHLFRLPGIYGPGRSALDTIRQGRTRRIHKKGQVFCRIHVDDLVTGLAASMAKPRPGAIYNLTDDEPAPPQDITAYAATLLGLEPEPLIPFEDADLTPMGRSFYGECKRVRNQRMKDELGVSLAYPTYRHGLNAILAQE